MMKKVRAPGMALLFTVLPLCIFSGFGADRLLKGEVSFRSAVVPIAIFGVLAIPVTVLVGLSFSGPIAAWAAHAQNEASFVAIFRFIILPMFLFSGTFFPISSLPRPLEIIAWFTPLWHGVTLCRDLTLGHIVPADALHLAYLLAILSTKPDWITLEND